MSTHISAKETLELLLSHLGQSCEVREEQRPMGLTLQVLTSDPDRLIGRNGKVLDDLQYLLNRIIHQTDEDDTSRILVDVENHRQQEFLQMIKEVDQSAQHVIDSGEEVELAPMNSFQRRLVHNHFKDNPAVQSYSPKSDERMKSIHLKKRA